MWDKFRCTFNQHLFSVNHFSVLHVQTKWNKTGCWSSCICPEINTYKGCCLAINPLLVLFKLFDLQKTSKLFLIGTYVFPALFCESCNLANGYNSSGILWNTDIFVPLQKILNPLGFPVATRMLPVFYLLFWTTHIEPSGLEICPVGEFHCKL